ncbi:MAG: adenylate/guanylate cyclase domain-containing protein [Flavobacteriales bacterium]|nr:adenylate/guanylate cyclase domain-containing protein [Flavobacteriales bacterium]MCB9193774.1 adenylate/guanylate cyclase domain-containing protein [Flavobacteriales bacterium]
MCFLLLALSARPTSGQVVDASWADSTYGSFVNSRLIDVGTSLIALDSLAAFYSRTNDRCHQVHVQAWRSHCYQVLGQLDSALSIAQKAQARFGATCDSLVLMSINVYLSNAYLSLGEFDKALAVSERSLASWNEAWPYSIARHGLYTDRAIALAYKGDLDGSLAAFHDELANARREGIANDEMDALTNLGALYGMMSESGKHAAFLDSSITYQMRALQIARRMNDRENQLLLFSNLAQVALDGGRPREALRMLASADTLATQLQNLEQSTILELLYSNAFKALHLTDSAYAHLKVHLALKDSLLNIEKVKAIADMQEKYESEKKARTIKELEVKNLDSELRKEQLTRTRNIYLFSGIGILMLAGGLYSRLRYTHRAKAIIQKEKEVSEDLLHNILPEEVAAELKMKGYADAREFEQATILFTDFKGFTSVAERLSAAELVAELNICFKAFDAIIDARGIEKIKTIGDAYMAAGGLPDPSTTRPIDVVDAALEMQAFMADHAEERRAKGLPAFEMRVGIHSGPVVAGIVGVKKFQYDIWGDTVNTASRMESSGAVGRVNLSEATYRLVKDAPGLRFEPRGKVQAKGKGELEMYFVLRSATGA